MQLAMQLNARETPSAPSARPSAPADRRAASRSLAARGHGDRELGRSIALELIGSHEVRLAWEKTSDEGDGGKIR